MSSCIRVCLRLLEKGRASWPKIHKLTNDNKQGTTLGIRNKYGQKYQLTVIDSPVYTVEGAHGHFFVESKNN